MKAKHGLSNYKLITMNQGNLVPVMCAPVVRGESWRQSSKALIRLSPLAKPTMHPVHARIHHWYVPNRILWTNWQPFITGGPDGNNASVHPTITLSSITAGSLANCLGLPVSATPKTVSALPFRAAAMIWNNFYRDKDLQTELAISYADGDDSTTSTALQNVCWNKDYFTTARPEPQLGDEVTIPLTGFGTVERTPNAPNQWKTVNATNNVVNTNGGNLEVNNGTGNVVNAVVSSPGINFDPQGGLRVDGEDFTAPSVIDVRLANALQRIKEARARYGASYQDYLNYYGIKSSNQALQLPEYLGGGRQTVQFSEVLATAESTGVDVGSLYGHGIGNVKSNSYQRWFEEDGFIISFMVVQPISMYVQGIPRWWSYTSKDDYFQKELQHIGQQAVRYKEVYADHTTPEGTFGWQDKYDELRRIENTVAGEFATTEVDWHMARIFSSDPALNADFVKANPTDRIYQSTASDQLYCYVFHNVQKRSPVAKQGKSFIY